MEFCPVYTNPQVRADFNSIVEDYGGKPLSQMEFKSVTLRGERWGRDKFAMDVAYYMWNKHKGNMEQIMADKEGAKYRLSEPTELYESTEDVDLSLDHLTESERSYLDVEVTIYDPFADEERGYDTRGPVERTMFTEANITKEKYKLPTKKYSNIEESVDILFEHKPELLKIGSKEAYSKYLNTIFPNTLNTNILYHIGGKNITKFDSSMFGKGEGVNALGEGVYFQENAYEIMSAGIGSDYFYESPNPILSMLQDGVLTMAVANIVGNDVYNKTLSVPQEVVIRDVDRIHILGSEQDIKGFKKFVESQEMPTQTIQEAFNKISNKYPETEGLLTENPVFTEDGTLLDQKSFKSSAQEAAHKIMQERVYGKELTQSNIQSINNELLKLSQSIGDADWSLKVSSKGNYYVAGYKNRGVLFDSYYSPYAEGIFRQQEGAITIGQANLETGTVLIDIINGKADTPYHEYAHHFIGWFRNTDIVQEGIKKWGSEEALVQSIGEQALKQKGEAWDWWTRFVNWMQNLFGKMSSLEKQELTNILTDAFLGRIDLETGKSLTTERINNLKELAKVTQPSILNQKQPTTTELKRAMGIRNNVSFNTLQRIKLSVDRYNDANNTSHKLDWKQNGISDSYDVDLIKDFTPVNAEWKAQRKEAWRQARTDDNLHGMENVSDAKFTAEELWLQKDIEKAKIIEERLVSLYGADTVYDSLEILDEMFNLYTEDTSETGRLIFLEQVLSGEYIIQC